ARRGGCWGGGRQGDTGLIAACFRNWGYGCRSFPDLATGNFPPATTRGNANEARDRIGPFQSGLLMETLTGPAPASPGTPTEPAMSAPHHRFLSDLLITIGLPPGCRAGNSMCATGKTSSGKTSAAKAPLPSPGAPTRTRSVNDP